jgi:hypothetical protein
LGHHREGKRISLFDLDVAHPDEPESQATA